MNGVVLLKLSEVEVLSLVIMLVVVVATQVLLQSLAHIFNIPIDLWVEGCGDLNLCIEDLQYGFSKITRYNILGFLGQ